MQRCNWKGIGESDDVTEVYFPHHSLLARGMRSHFGHPENLNIILAPKMDEILDPKKSEI